MNGKAFLAWLLTWLAGAMFGLRADFQGSTHIMPFDEDTIGYSKTKASGPVARLQERIDSGEIKLRYDDTYGYLPAVLEVARNVALWARSGKHPKPGWAIITIC